MKASNKPKGWLGPVLIAAVLALLFWRSFLPGFVHFNNDGPLAQQKAAWTQLPAAFTGSWSDLNDIGGNGGSSAPDVIALMRWALHPFGVEGDVLFAKFVPAIDLFILGLGAWMFFRQLRLSPLAAVLGGLAATLNSAFFSTACWGVSSQQVAIGMDFFALALIVSNTPETSVLTRWVRWVLAGLAVGANVMQGADIGAIFSVFIAAFVLFKTFVDETGSTLSKLARAVGRVSVIAIFAGFLAAQTVVALVGTSITGIVGAGTEQGAETPERHWDWATQWSEPKIETLGLVVPGLFGYRMDTPKDMMALQDSYKGGNYWGAVGRDPAWDRYFAGGKQGQAPNPNYQYFRFSGGGGYAGILVVLVAVWAIAQSLRRKGSVFGDGQRRMIWFWAALLVVALLLSYGRFAPFYKLFYMLPYASTIRNPSKFILVFSWALVIIFSYGIHGLSRRYMEVPASGPASPLAQFKSWWAKIRGFDRNWTLACVIASAATVLATMIYATQKANLVRQLQEVGFPDPDYAGNIAAFSIRQAAWFIPYFVMTAGLCTLVIAGVFSGKRAKLGGILLGALLIADLGRANMPWVIHWDYKQKYDIDPSDLTKTTNPIISFLGDKPYEHRVTFLPYFEPPPNLGLFETVYKIEWVQHHFPYYNIQSLDIVQRPRVGSDSAAYEGALAFRGTQETLYLIARHWQLTNTRYVLGAISTHLPMGDVDTLSFLNQGMDPAQQRFRLVQRFEIVPKPGVETVTSYEELTASVNEKGNYALYEFTGALPRAKLYSNWQLPKDDTVAVAELTTNKLDTNTWAVLQHMGTNDFLTLEKLASPLFDPQQTVLLADSPASPNSTSTTNENSGTVEYTSYSPKHIRLHTQAATATILLLNDKYDPNWRVTVDGKPAPLLRANFIMRGVYLTKGEHTVEFNFSLPIGPLWVTSAAILLGILLCGLLASLTRKPTLQQKNKSK